MQKGKTIYVLHVERQSVQGRHNYSVDLSSGSRVSIGRTRAQGVKIPMGFIGGTKLKTGLDEVVENPFYGLDYNDLDDATKPGSNWIQEYDRIKTQRMLDKQTLFEMYDNVPKNTYTSIRSTSNMAEIGTNIEMARRMEQSYLERFVIYLHEGVNVFSDNTQRGRLGIQVCENHPKIATSIDLVNPDVHEFYIGSKEEAAIQKNKRIDKVMDTIANLKKVQDDYDSFTSYQFGVILTVASGQVSPTFVESSLKEFVWEAKKTNFGTQEERLVKFNEVFDTLRNDPDRFYIQYLIRQALNSGVFLISGTRHVMWPSKKGMPNLYDLGTNLKKIENMFLEQFNLYQPGLDADNWFYDLEVDLKQRGIQCK